MPLADAFLPEFDHEMDLLRRTLERVPEERFAWRPHPRARSLGELADHLARIPGWAGSMLENDSYDLAARKAGSVPEVSATTATMLAFFAANRRHARAAIAARSDDDLNRPWRLERDGQILETMPTVRALRVYLLDHVIHHRGQLAVYLRLLDIAVPGLYGPSADEPA
ncbi:MAG: DinB family protein [Candidatus Eisenbacteria bacterium]